jgi:hypothetical protein
MHPQKPFGKLQRRCSTLLIKKRRHFLDADIPQELKFSPEIMHSCGLTRVGCTVSWLVIKNRNDLKERLVLQENNLMESFIICSLNFSKRSVSFFFELTETVVRKS